MSSHPRDHNTWLALQRSTTSFPLPPHPTFGSRGWSTSLVSIGTAVDLKFNGLVDEVVDATRIGLVGWTRSKEQHAPHRCPPIHVVEKLCLVRDNNSQTPLISV
jgi:hypothetical protein